MAVSIADVASHANVSISTVSRVVNGHDVVNAVTRKRVEKAIAELGYRPNVFARGLMLNRSNIVALALPDLHGEFYSEVIRGANARARELDYQLIVSSVSSGDSGSSLLASLSGNALADGAAVMVPETSPEIEESLSGAKVPLVIIDRDCEHLPYDSVAIDHQSGTNDLMEHLLSDPEIRRMIFVGGPKTNVDSMVRFENSKRAWLAAGREQRASDVFHLDFQYESAYDLATKKLPDWIGPHNCVFAGNDEMAAGIMHAALAAGIAIPDELRVVGFDDIRIAQLMKPRLTTVRVPMSEMGAAAVDLLTQRIQDARRPRTKITLQSDLVVRESCGVRPSRSGESA